MWLNGMTYEHICSIKLKNKNNCQKYEKKKFF